jgi:hypothetical protein
VTVPALIRFFLLVAEFFFTAQFCSRISEPFREWIAKTWPSLLEKFDQERNQL